MAGAFIIARNPDGRSRLPFLLRLPIDGGLWFKVRESWPRASRVYCHRCEDPTRPEQLEVLERVPVIACTRRGITIDLVLERGLNRRSQFVFATARGRPLVLWQTPKVAALARPGVRVAFGVPQALEKILIDTRERYGYTFAASKVRTERVALRYGDYLAVIDEQPVAVVERKSALDFAHSLNTGSLAFALAELSALPSAVVVESSYAQLLRTPHVSGIFLSDVLVRLQLRYPQVAIIFAETRTLGEFWTFSFFRAAAAERSPQLPLSAVLANASTDERGRRPRAPRGDTRTPRRR